MPTDEWSRPDLSRGEATDRVGREIGSSTYRCEPVVEAAAQQFRSARLVHVSVRLYAEGVETVALSLPNWLTVAELSSGYTQWFVALQRDRLPRHLALARPASPAFERTSTLADAGVRDGEVLVLLDLAELVSHGSTACGR